MIRKFLSVLIAFALLAPSLPSGAFTAAVAPSAGFAGFGTITSANFYDGDTIVINIQDLHNNKEVQENTYKLLTSLNKKYKDIEVYLEGASKDVNMNELVRGMDKNSADTIMDVLYRGTQISGTEYFGYKNNKILKPTEESGIYDENIKNFAELIDKRQEIKNLLEIKETNIKNLSDRYLNASQRRILRIYKKYRNKQIDANKFYERLLTEIQKSQTNLNKYINFSLYLEILKQNKQTDKIKAQKQLQQLLYDLKGTVSFREYTDLLKLSDNLTNMDVVFSYISSKVSNVDRYVKYPDLFKMIDIIEKAGLVDPLDLVAEEGEIINDLLLAGCKHKIQKDVVFLNNFITIYENFILANISFNEYNVYKRNIRLFYKLYYKYMPDDNFTLLIPYEKTAEKFNELNIKRNELFAKNILSGIDRASVKFNKIYGKYSNIDMTLKALPAAKKIKVVVTGGFHTSGVNKILDKNKISYLTITPNIKNKDNNFEKLYFNNILAQADADRNAIAAMPLSEQYPLPLAKDLAEIISVLRQSGKSWQDISKMFNSIIRERELSENIKFSYDAEAETAVFDIAADDGNPRKIEYKKGSIAINGDSVFQSTALGEHLKMVITQALTPGTFTSRIREYSEIKNNDYMAAALSLLDTQGVMLPSLKDAILMYLFLFEADNSEFEYESVLKDELRKKSMSDYEIVVGQSYNLMGKKDDTYGQSTEYGCLAYVDYDRKIFYIHSDLINYFKNSVNDKSPREAEIAARKFFHSLVIHETLERDALTGRDLIFDEYLVKKQPNADGQSQRPYSTAAFHEFLQSGYVEGKGYSAEEIARQREILDIFDVIIQDVNYRRSEYGDVISIVQSNTEYPQDIKSDWLAIRAGDAAVVSRYAKSLADKIFEQMKSQANYHAGYYVIAYRKSSTQQYMREIVKSVEYELNQKKSPIPIKMVEIEEDADPSVQGPERFKVQDESAISDAKIFFIDDIISKQSDTFHYIYLYFKNKGNVVQPCVFFDLSQEDLNNTLSDQTYDDILKDSSEFIALLKQFNPKVTKYPIYWLVRMINDNEKLSAKQLNRFINALNKTAKRKIITAAVELLNSPNKIRGVNLGDLIYLIACLAAGKKLDFNEVGDALVTFFKDGANSDMASLFGAGSAAGKVMEVDYYDWQDKTALAIPYAKIKGYDMLKVAHLGYMTDLQRATVALYAQKYKIVFEDEKRKLKHKRFEPYISRSLKDQIADIQKRLVEAQNEFKNKKITSAEYAKKVKEIMNRAVEISLKIVKDNYNINIERTFFDIIVGGSLTKGNMMFDSDIYYDIVTPNEDMSVLIDEKFAPVYSFILNSIGLETYAVTKYSSSFDNKQNMSTVTDERGTAVFMDYEPLYDDDSSKEEYKRLNLKLINKYLKSLLKQALENKEETLKLIRAMTGNYYSVSINGSGWIGNSFVQSHDENSSFNTRYTILALESKLKEIIFEYLSGLSGDEVDKIEIPKGVGKQIDFIKRNIKTVSPEVIDTLYLAWRSLSQIRFDRPKDAWSGFYTGLEKSGLMNETEARKVINDFIDINLAVTKFEQNRDFNSRDFLQIVETFIYANSKDVTSFKTAYRKYRHIENLLVNIKADEDNNEVEYMAKAIALLSDFDDATLLKFYEFPQIAGNGHSDKINEYIEIVKKSIETIKKIDEFPKYPELNGWRTLQNYWDNIIQISDNPQTLLALFAYMLEKTKNIEDDEKTKEGKKKNDYLETMYNIYLPSIYRLLGSGAYEYARNNLFISTNPVEYLNILKLVKQIYGADIPQLTEFKDMQIVVPLKRFLAAKGFDLKNITIKSRVKTPYSMFEKMTSGRRNKTQPGELGKDFNPDDPKIISEFLKQIRDVTGLHIIIESPDISQDALSEALKEFIALQTAKRVDESENKRELERIKYNFSIGYPKGKTEVPVEACIYSRKSYNDETFGRYDPNKKDVKEPHFIYKLGTTIKENFYAGIFFKGIKRKNFVITTDDEDISDDFCGNFNKIKNKIQTNRTVMCFVEYWNEVYVVDVPEGSVLMDVIFQPYFTNEHPLVVYNSDGYLLNNKMPVKSNGYYKIAIGEGKPNYDKKAGLKTVRARLYRAIINGKEEISETGSDAFKEKLEKINAVERIQKLIDKVNDGELDWNLFLNIISDIQLFDGILKNREEYNKIIMRAQYAAAGKILEALSSVSRSAETAAAIEKFKKIIGRLQTGNEFLSAENKTAIDEIIISFMQMLDKENSKKSDAAYDNLKVLFFLETRQVDMYMLAAETAQIKRAYLDIGSVSVSDFFTNSVKIANHYNLLNVGELWQAFVLGILDRHTVIKNPDGREMELANYYDPDYRNKIMPLISLGRNVKKLAEYVAGVPLLEEYSGLVMQMLLSLYEQGAYDIEDLLAKETPFLLQSEADFVKETVKNRLGLSKVDIKVSPSQDLFMAKDAYSFATLDVGEDTATLYISEMFLKQLENGSDEYRERILALLVEHELGEYEFLRDNPEADYEKFHEQPDQKELLDFADEIAAQISESAMETNAENIEGFNNAVFGNIPENGSYLNGVLMEFAKIIPGVLTGVTDINADGKSGLDAIPSEVLKSVLFVIQNLGDDRDNVRQNIFVLFNNMKINGKQNPIFASKESFLAEISKTGISKTKYALIEKYINWIYETDQTMPEKDIAIPESITSRLEKDVENTRKILFAA
jgi:hypothetical protein